MFRIVRVDPNCDGDPMSIERGVLDGLAGVTLDRVSCDTASDIIRAASDADVIITHFANITKEVLAALPKCRAVVRYGVGYDTVDVRAASEFGVYVINVPDFCGEEVSNHVMAFLLTTCKKLPELCGLVKRGKWDEAKAAQAPMRSIHGETLGIVGCGNIGRMVAKKARAFSMEVIGDEKYASLEKAESTGIKLVPFEQLLKESDFITLHVALSDKTRHLFSRNEFAMMKSNSILINTSRGPVVDEAALIDALKNDEISGACLDVFEEEPLPIDSPLLFMNNVILTPHSASYSDAAFGRLKRSVMEESLRVMRNEYPLNVVNKAVTPKKLPN